MPPAAAIKSARSSLYGWAGSKKRSVSPTAAPAPALLSVATVSAQKGAPPAPAPQPVSRKVDDLYFEEEYREEVMEYMHLMEAGTLAAADLMDMQPELQWYMRPYLIDFLVEIHQQFRLRPEVLYLASNIVDRYVSKRVVYKKHYQLVGCASLWIAAKFEDGKDRVPLVKELADMCCKAYDESAFIQMEGHVLSTIGWCIGHPTAEAWLRIAVNGKEQEEPRVQNAARFMMEITLFHREFVGIQSSLISEAALMLARFIYGKPRMPVSRFEHVVVRIAQAIDKQFADKLETISEIVIRKYAPVYYSRCSTYVREWYQSGRRFVYQPVTPATPVAVLPSPGLAPSNSGWSNKLGSFGGSPGTISCSSSENGDDGPRTPVTPMHHNVNADPFSVAAKENIAPRGHPLPVPIKDRPTMINPAAYGARPALHAMNDLALPNRPIRRLSN